MMPSTLDPDRLYLFVFGPGLGESTLLRVPPDLWIVIDSCYLGDKPAALHVLPRYGGQCSCVVLTHRHQDHYPGFSGVVDYGNWSCIGCSDLYLDPGFGESRDLETRLTGELEQAFAAIQERWSENELCAWWTWRKTRRTVGEAELTALHPPDDFARNYVGTDRNELSSAMLVRWRDVRLLLGADVPNVPNPHWSAICAAFENLNQHQAMKAPHHGSTEAIADELLDGDRKRLWLVTPYSRGKKVPSFANGKGLHRMLQHVDEIYLTGLPEAHDRQGEQPCWATRTDLLNKVKPRPKTFELPGGISGTQAPARDDLSCYLVAAFSPDGRGEMVSFGPGTVAVTEG